MILPKSKTIEADLYCLFTELVTNRGEVQIRKGRYVINSTGWRINECLLLNDYDSVVDGFVKIPVYCLPWKGEPFFEHLKRLKGKDN